VRYARCVWAAEVTPVARDETQGLVERARGGDRAAFDALALRYGPLLVPVIAKRLGEPLRGRVSVEDIRQETFLRAFGAIGRFECRDNETGRSFFRWLCGIAVRVILESASKGRRERPFAIAFDAACDDPSPSKSLVRKERAERFDHALAGLSEDHRTVLKLVRLEGLSVKEAAERMRRTPNAVSLLLSRALRKLRESFGDTESVSLAPLPPPDEEERSGV
jgi:RNA polymerase sigma-70 factor, ECF subfamily